MSVTPEELRRQKSLQGVRPPDRNILVAVRCFATGRVVPTAKLCVDEQASLRDVIVAWARGVMSFEGGFLPPGVSALGSEGSLDLEASLNDLRRLLPVLQGRPTISVRWPATAQVAPSVQAAVVAKVAAVKKTKEKAQVSAFVSTKKKAVEKVKVPKKIALKEKVAKAKTEKAPKEKKEKKEGKRGRPKAEGGGKAEENGEAKVAKRKKVDKASKENQVNGDGKAKAPGAGSSSSSSDAASSSSSSDSDDDAIGAITRYLMASDDEQEKEP